MLVVKGRSEDPEASLVVRRAMLCKLFRCTPKELDELDWDEVERLEAAYAALAKKDPLFLLM